MEVLQEPKRIEPVFTQADRDRVWELYFGKKWSAKHIAEKLGTRADHIIAVIDSESERRWRINHPHETNRIRLHSEEGL